VSHLCGVGFERSDLTLPVVQPATHGSAYVLVLSIGDASERQQLASSRIVYLKRGQHLFYIYDAR
jgi:hypothetical protein